MPKRKTYKRRKRKAYSTKGSRLKRRIAVFTFAVLAIFVSAAVLVGFSAYKFIHAPFTSASGVDYSDTDLVFTGDETNLLLLKVDDINDKYSEVNALAVISFDQISNRYSIYHIPVNEEVEYVQNYGSGPLSRAYAVGNADQDRGIYLIQKTLHKYLAINTDGYILVDNNGMQSITDVIGEINQEDLSASLRLRNMTKMPEFVSVFRNVSQTNLKLKDIHSIAMFIRNTSETSSHSVYLTRYQLLDSDKWDTLWQSKANRSDVNKENVKVFVANASKSPRIAGLAGWGGRVVENIGASVLDTQNSFADYNENTIITNDTELETVKKLARVLDIDRIIHVNDLDPYQDQNPQIYRAKVSIILVKY